MTFQEELRALLRKHEMDLIAIFMGLRRNPVGVVDLCTLVTQGSSFLATLGWRTQSFGIEFGVTLCFSGRHPGLIIPLAPRVLGVPLQVAAHALAFSASCRSGLVPPGRA